MPALKTSFEKDLVIKPLHTGGPVVVSADGQSILTCVGEEVVLTNLENGRELARFSADGETIHSFCLAPNSSHLLVFTASLALFIYADPLSVSTSSKTVRASKTVARSHEAPVHVCIVDRSSTFLASGSADGVVKVWDIQRGYVTHAFKGHGGVISALAFRFVQDTSSAVNVEPIIQLLTGCVDTKLRVFDLNSKSGGGKPLVTLEGHVSVPRAIDISADGKRMISAGRDSVVLVWEFQTNTGSSKGKAKEIPGLRRTIPALERVEAAGLIPSDLSLGLEGTSAERSLYFFTAGEKGAIKIWDGQRGMVLFSLNELQKDAGEAMEVQREIVHASYLPSQSSIISVHADHNILFHSLSSRRLSRQLIGFNDEIVDVCFLSSSTSPDSHLAVATNSSLIRVYSTSENDARLLSGHSGMLLCLSPSADGTILASGSKDKTVRVWICGRDQQIWSCVAVCEGHAESVGAVVIARKVDDKGRPRLLFSGSQDRTIKMWDLASLPAYPDDTKEVHKCKSLVTHKAHDKDINSLDISPDGAFLASGSQDKTAKVYEISYAGSGSGTRGELKLLGTCKGHKRGVWTVKFGSFDKVLATGSGDKTVKLWNLDDFSCVKTFEGHTNSVLRVEFLNRDMQLATTASDGLFKLWNVRMEECQATMDNHEDKVWALAKNSKESIVATGAADSVITLWRDCTEEKKQQQEAEREEAIAKDQNFANYVALRDYRSAISLALAMDQPGRLFSLFKEVLSRESNEQEGGQVVQDAIRDLSHTELLKLIRHIRTWNASAKSSMVAQTILRAVFKFRTTADISDALSRGSGAELTSPPASRDNDSLGELVQSLTPYTERHLARIDRLVQESYILDYILGEMDAGILVDSDDMLMSA